MSVWPKRAEWPFKETAMVPLNRDTPDSVASLAFRRRCVNAWETHTLTL
jgi:hypothetical protein